MKHRLSLVAFKGRHRLSPFGRGWPWSEPFPSVHQRGRHLRREVTSRYARSLCAAPPSLPNHLAKLARTATPDNHMRFLHPPGSRTPWPTTSAKTSKHDVFPESFATLGQLPDMAQGGNRVKY